MTSRPAPNIRPYTRDRAATSTAMICYRLMSGPNGRRPPGLNLPYRIPITMPHLSGLLVRPNVAFGRVGSGADRASNDADVSSMLASAIAATTPHKNESRQQHGLACSLLGAQILLVSHLLPASLIPTHPAVSLDISMTSNWSSLPICDFSLSRISPGVSVHCTIQTVSR
jgi:hypothetical protein